MTWKTEAVYDEETGNWNLYVSGTMPAQAPVLSEQVVPEPD